MRNVKFPVSMPGPTERLIGPDGTATPAFQAVLETVVNQAGGQGGDASFDTFTRAVVESERNAQNILSVDERLRAIEASGRTSGADAVALLGDRLDRIEQQLGVVGALRAEVASLGDLARSSQIVDGLVSEGAAIKARKVSYPAGSTSMASNTNVGATEVLLAEVSVTDSQEPSFFFFGGSEITYPVASDAASADTAILTWRLRASTASGGVAGDLLATGEITFTSFGGTVIVDSNTFPPDGAMTTANTGTIYLKLTAENTAGGGETIYTTGNGGLGTTTLKYTGFGNITE